MAQAAWGAKLEVQIEQTGSYITIGAIETAGLKIKGDALKTTGLGDIWHRFMRGRLEADLAFTIYFDPSTGGSGANGETGSNALATLVTGASPSVKLSNFKMTDGELNLFSFAGVLTQFDIDQDGDQPQKVAVGVKVSGAITFTAATGSA